MQGESKKPAAGRGPGGARSRKTNPAFGAACGRLLVRRASAGMFPVSEARNVRERLINSARFVHLLYGLFIRSAAR